jgi:hypothetical protein
MKKRNDKLHVAIVVEQWNPLFVMQGIRYKGIGYRGVFISYSLNLICSAFIPYTLYLIPYTLYHYTCFSGRAPFEKELS